VVFIGGAYSFLKGSFHLVNILISLEFLVLRVLIILILNFFCSKILFIILIFLVFSVCEGALGLRIVISIVRGFGGDFIRCLRISVGN